MKKKNEASNALPFEAAKREETLPLLLSGIPRNARLQCWSPGRKYSYISRIMKVHEAADLISITVSKEYPGGDSFEADLFRESLGEVLFSLHLPTDVIFFKGELRKGDSTFFNARIKGPVYKVQRRESLRLPIPGAESVILGLPGDQSTRVELLNVSEGGIAISFRGRADFDAVAGLKEPISLSFSAFGIAVTAKAIVRHSSEVGSSLMKKSYRLGLSFTEIDPKTRALLSQLVFEESAKYLGRF